MKKVLFSSALMLAAAISFAGTPKGDVKSETPAKTESESGAVLKWFHFNGSNANPSDLTDPSKYTAESAPVCSSETNDYRCDIKILTQVNDQSKPDLTQSPVEERTRDTE